MEPSHIFLNWSGTGEILNSLNGKSTPPPIEGKNKKNVNQIEEIM